MFIISLFLILLVVLVCLLVVYCIPTNACFWLVRRALICCKTCSALGLLCLNIGRGLVDRGLHWIVDVLGLLDIVRYCHMVHINQVVLVDLLIVQYIAILLLDLVLHVGD